MSDKQLYTFGDLISGFDHKDPMSYLRTWDFGQFQTFVAEGGATPKTIDARRRQSGHDSEIADALRRYLEAKRPRLVGIMGGHSVNRDQAAYRLIADLARFLTRAGFLIVTGGGPGAMEAGHLGAFFATATDGVYEAAIAELGRVPKLPNISGLLDEDGNVRPGSEQTIKDAHGWLMAALRATELVKTKPGESLAIPTWLYGHEPTVPFATAYAKYFQNSIREEALITEARAGIIYSRGGGGTIREIFQDVEQNYYVRRAADFTPMIFVDPEKYWQKDATFDEAGVVITFAIKLDDLLSKLFKVALAPTYREECLSKVRFTTDFNEIQAVLSAHQSSAQKKLQLMLKGGAANLLSARWNR